MKVILNEDVPGLGEPGKIVDVAPGYARNFLVPRGLAIYADRASIKELEHHEKRLARKRMKLEEAAKSLAEKINGSELIIETRSGEGGKLYGSVTTSDIAKVLNAEFDLTVDRRKISLAEPIRSLGKFQASVDLIGEAKATITINVTDPNAEVAAVKTAEVVETTTVVEAAEEVIEDDVAVVETAEESTIEVTEEEA